MSVAEACELFAPRSVFLPSDNSLASRTAFAHALAFSLIGAAEFTILDTTSSHGVSDRGLRTGPGVRNTLHRWGVLGADAGDVSTPGCLGMRVKRVEPPDDDLPGAVAHQVRCEQAELLVVGLSGPDSVPPWLSDERLLLAGLPLASVMLVPPRASGFVSLRDGTLSLREIVVVADQSPDPAPAIEAAARIARSFSESDVLCRVLRMGTEPVTLPPKLPSIGQGCWASERVPEAEPQDIALASTDADLIVMPVAARDGGDVLASIHAGFVAQLTRRCLCPVLLVPSRPRPIAVGAAGAPAPA